MINSPDIRKYLAQKLKGEGFTVVASEDREGFSKPVVFLYVYPRKVTLYGESWEDDIFSVNILFIPKSETAQECAEAAEKIKRCIFSETMNIQNRRLTIESMELDIDDAILNVGFEINVTQLTEYKEDIYENAGILELEQTE